MTVWSFSCRPSARACGSHSSQLNPTTTVRGRGERGVELLQPAHQHCSRDELNQRTAWGRARCTQCTQCAQCGSEIDRRGSFLFSPALQVSRGCSPCYLLLSRRCSCWASSPPPPPPSRKYTRCRSDAQQRHSSAARAPQHAARGSPHRTEARRARDNINRSARARAHSHGLLCVPMPGCSSDHVTTSLCLLAVL